MSTQKPHFLPPLPFTCLSGVRTSAPSSSLHPPGPWPRSDLSGLGACCSCGSQPYPKALPPWDGDLEAQTPALAGLPTSAHSPPTLTDAPFILRQPRLFRALRPFIGHFPYTMSCNP